MMNANTNTIIAITAILAATTLALTSFVSVPAEACGRCWVVQPGQTYSTTVNDAGQLVKLSCTIQTKNVNGHIGMGCEELN